MKKLNYWAKKSSFSENMVFLVEIRVNEVLLMILATILI